MRRGAKLRKAEMVKEARTGGLHTRGIVHVRTCTRGLNVNFHSRPGMIKGRVAFYARSFHFRARQPPPRLEHRGYTWNRVHGQ